MLLLTLVLSVSALFDNLRDNCLLGIVEGRTEKKLEVAGILWRLRRRRGEVVIGRSGVNTARDDARDIVVMRLILSLF